MTALTNGFLGGVCGAVFAFLSKMVIVDKLSFLSGSGGELVTLFTFFWYSVLIILGFVIGAKFSSFF
jgi:hypothetical protein